MFGPRGGLPRGGMRDFGLGAGARGRGSRQPFAVIMALRLLHQISNLQRKPPLTLTLMAAMTVIHLKPDVLEDLLGGGGATGLFSLGWLTGAGVGHIRSLCFLPATILDSYARTGALEFRRFLISPFVHGDDMHLYYNMASFLLKGVSLELTMGSQAYAGLLAFSLLASQALMLLLSWVLLETFDMPGPMHACTVGFSGVLFALKYVLSRHSPGTTTVMGFRIHTRFAAWLELVLISVLVPNASFLGHLCGILAGILYVEVPIVLPALSLLSGFALFNQAPSYTYNSGTASAAAARGHDSGGRSGQGATPPRRAAPQSAAPSDFDDASAEEAEFQEALRRSLRDTGRRGGGYEGGHGSENDRAYGGTGNGADTVEAWRVAPSAPRDDGPSGMGRGGQGDIGADELRRRRLQRLNL